MVLVAVVALLTIGAWIFVQWLAGVVEGVSFFQNRNRANETYISDASAALRFFDGILPPPYNAVDSVRGNINLDPGSETLVIGENATALEQQYIAFIFDAANQLVYTSLPLPAKPYAVQVRSDASGQPEFRLMMRINSASTSRIETSLHVRWDGTGFASDIDQAL